MAPSIPQFLLLILAIPLGTALLPESPDPEKRHYACEAVSTDWQGSAYVLPYAIGKNYRVSQANCSGHGHSNFWNHGYDFVMEEGTPIVAARAGVVTKMHDRCLNGDRTCTNLITIRHRDGTVALYSHLARAGVEVVPTQVVALGQLIGHSGNTGNTGDLPHLHFSVHPCNDLPGLGGASVCPSMRVNFRNTEANPAGPAPLHAYLALPYNTSVNR